MASVRNHRRPLFECLESRHLLTTVLYDAALQSSPDQQQWLYLTRPIVGAKATQQMQSGAVQLDSRPDRSEQAGYFGHLHPALPTLNRHGGFRLGLDVQVLEERHVSQHRAGFSVILLDDGSKGVELGFWEDQIWAQTDDPLFEHGEHVSVDTTAAIQHYDLFILSDHYLLVQGGQPILTGPLRDYSVFGAPYDIRNFLFLGDDTSSADALILLSGVQIETGVLPEICLAFGERKLADADPVPVDFGGVRVGASMPQRTLEIKNTGRAPLILDGRDPPPGFRLVGTIPESVMPGQTSQLTLAMETTATGHRSGTVRLTSNDPLQSPFRISVRGYVSAGPVGQNPDQPLDVSGEGEITPRDVLILINYINAHPGQSQLPPASPPPFLDPSGDDLITAIDVLLVINHLNSP